MAALSCMKFDAKCYYFYISALVSFSLIGVCTAIIFTKNDDPCIKNTAVGILTSILTFWANPPRLNNNGKSEMNAADIVESFSKEENAAKIINDNDIKNIKSNELNEIKIIETITSPVNKSTKEEIISADFSASPGDTKKI
jgi:high-affinity K+ transport system ATPase subunit B